MLSLFIPQFPSFASTQPIQNVPAGMRAIGLGSHGSQVFMTLQAVPDTHVPHCPPQPSDPHALLAQLGVQHPPV